MLVNQNDVDNSVIIVASKIIEYNFLNKITNVNELMDTFILMGIAYSSIILSLDWLYMTGILKNIDEDGEMIYDFN